MLQRSSCCVATEPTRQMRNPIGTGKAAGLIALKGRGAATTWHYRALNVREDFPMLAGFVEEIWDWDVPDPDLARSLAIKLLPSTTPCLMVQYRESLRSSRTFLGATLQHRRYHSMLTRLDTGVCIARPPGPLGAIVVRFKPEASALLFAESLQCFSDVKIDLGDVFGRQEVALLEGVVAEVRTSVERMAAVAQFLCDHMYARKADPVLSRAAARLRSDPSTRVHQLAADLDVSERHLLRVFRSAFGVTPKQFARCARIEKAVAERTRGSTWADIACGCGFADQAHMINDFNAVLGISPERALLPPSAEQALKADVPNGSPIARDFLYW
jgi:AraC-like DNA-binding protein